MKFNVKGISAISLLGWISLTDVCPFNWGVIGAGHLFVLRLTNLILLCRHYHPDPCGPILYVPCVHLESPASFYISNVPTWTWSYTFPPINETVCWWQSGIRVGIQKRVWWKSRTFITQLFGALFIPFKLQKILLQLVGIHGRQAGPILAGGKILQHWVGVY